MLGVLNGAPNRRCGCSRDTLPIRRHLRVLRHAVRMLLRVHSVNRIGVNTTSWKSRQNHRASQPCQDSGVAGDLS